jgi:hypothetical protein
MPALPALLLCAIEETLLVGPVAQPDRAAVS